MQPLRAMQRVGTRVATVGRTTSIRALSSNISGGSLGKAWADKEHAAENQYFNQKDAEVLARLADKLKNHTAVSCKPKQVLGLFSIGTARDCRDPFSKDTRCLQSALHSHVGPNMAS